MADEDIFSGITLDKSRPFGTVHPPEDGAHFAQDGFHFGPDGELVRHLLTKADEDRLARIVARRNADKAANEARRKALEAAGFGDEEIKAAEQAVNTVAQSGAADADKIDLKAWGRGEIQVPWFKVRTAFQEQYSRVVDSKQTAIEFLVEEGLIEADPSKAGA